MIKNSAKIFFILLLSVLGGGCGAPKLYIPQAESTFERQKEFMLSFETTWANVLKTIQEQNGVVITQDKASGLIVYSVMDSTLDLTSQSTGSISGSKSKRGKTYPVKIYVNLHISRDQNTGTTTIFFIPRTKIGHFMRDVGKDFFAKFSENVLGGTGS